MPSEDEIDRTRDALMGLRPDAQAVFVKEHAGFYGQTKDLEKVLPVSVAAIQSLITSLEAERDAAKTLCDTLRSEAKIQAQEARTQAATVNEIYQLCTGSTGEPGTWNGAEPVRQIIGERDRFRAVAEHYADQKRWHHSKYLDAGFETIQASLTGKSRNEYGYDIAQAALKENDD